MNNPKKKMKATATITKITTNPTTGKSTVGPTKKMKAKKISEKKFYGN